MVFISFVIVKQSHSLIDIVELITSNTGVMAFNPFAIHVSGV